MKAVTHQVNLLSDNNFKCIFGQETRESEELAAYLIEVFAKILIYRINAMNRELILYPNEGKRLELDALFEINNGIFVDLEMQNRKAQYDPERMINYLSGMNQLMIRRGGDHRDGKCILIMFCAYPLKHEADRNQTGKMRFPSGNVLSQRLSLIHVDLSDTKDLLNKQVEEMSQTERYCVYLKHSHQEKYHKLIQELCEKEEGLMEINEYVYNEQEAVRDFLTLMHRLDKASREQKLQKKLKKATKKIKKQVQETAEEKRLREQETQRRIQAESMVDQEVQRRVQAESMAEQEIQRRIQAEYQSARSSYIISCVDKGYELEQAKEMANQKYPNIEETERLIH